MSDKTHCVYCQRAVDEECGGICDECFEPIAQYMEAGGTPKEYFQALISEACKLVIQEVTDKVIQEAAKDLLRDS